MPSLLESTEYESFSLKDWDAKPLTLDEAIRKAEALRSRGEAKVYRVLPTDASMISFRVREISPEEVQAAFANRIAAFRARWLRYRRR